MAISTQILNRAAAALATVLQDSIQLYSVGEPVTVGFEVTRELTPVGTPVAGLVQTTTLANATESAVSNVYSIKVAAGTALEAGMAIKALTCVREPSLVGKTLLIDKISQNGLALIRKAVASDFHLVNQQGKENMS